MESSKLFFCSFCANPHAMRPALWVACSGAVRDSPGLPVPSPSTAHRRVAEPYEGQAAEVFKAWQAGAQAPSEFLNFCN